MIFPLFIGLMTLLAATSLWLSKTAARSQSSKDFFLMGRKLGLFGLTMSLLATQIGGGALLGSAEEAYTKGWSVLFYPLGMVLGLMVLGLGYGAKMRRLNLTTIPEIFEKIYGSVKLRQIASFLSIASLFMILVGQGIAAHKFFVSLGFHGNVLFVLFWATLIGYTAIGGLAAAVKADILQASFIMGALAISVFATLYYSVESMPSFLSVLHMSSENTPWVSWLLLPLLFMLIEQDMGQWCFAAKNPKTVSIAALSSALILIIVALIPIFFGTAASLKDLHIEPGSSVLIAAVEAMTHPFVATLVICAILMAIISTANSLLCSVSSNIVCDFPKLSQSIMVSRVTTLLVGIASLLLAFVFDNVVTVLMFAYELAVCVLFVPVTMAVWAKAPLKRSALISMSLGAATFVFLKFWTSPFPKELICLGCSFSGFLCSESITRYKPKKVSS